MSHSAIQTIMQHRSIRKFKDKKLTNDQIQTIVKAAQMASTSSYVMAYTIIGVTDERIKEQLAAISGQPYVQNNGHLFVFCGDLHRATQLGAPDEIETMQASLASPEQFIVMTVDAALASQNAATAAEDLGLGICYLGSLRNDIRQVSEILQLPERVVPLFGMAVGYPDHKPEQKPRLPFEVVYHENHYQPFEQQLPFIKKFDEKLQAYYEERKQNSRNDNWSKQIIRKFSTPIRMDVGPFLHDKNVNKQ
ncbi:oxygen-insensitive NADPH nitroreductase [Virgibacillus pantothenticus]|uniref:oxygen-insensitive NADPH nitroreductase n=1 Tax=Virgibacillus pantothenticus TaxID=1473 RepID=UPI001C241A7F|nr:oxygen-insensitive NADPH nitroreductase [Virgibacillus pantothenticus]MBU8565035.1 oxygen-insensitive NADPH nitroreductase [Virgibacillus pantothenticus]MBU8599342.1 oxygen-insensitive NADPH nitroreductase [Virgibacillus pantothenticus]MBU8633255.1 oxygen-insensitive NADPH nitroreductase [Virgibacillus pantothenticus]MBU8641084.1 oxygen-insensitive NADPH nitroreductase [Virgibacillus pantothenticus]MBU8644987.1 oxygen-insensitive NADPH nitroreductase [Virgibacillus pantothenticus]